jgi:hypothetical protein
LLIAPIAASYVKPPTSRWLELSKATTTRSSSQLTIVVRPNPYWFRAEYRPPVRPIHFECRAETVSIGNGAFPQRGLPSTEPAAVSVCAAILELEPDSAL